MRLGNIEVDFSFTNTNNLRKLEEAYKRVLEKGEKNSKKTIDFIEKMDNECNIGREFFNEVFGEGIDKKLFGEDNDYEKIMDMLENVMEEYQKQYKRIDEKYSKYSSNRAQRRKKK